MLNSRSWIVLIKRLYEQEYGSVYYKNRRLTKSNQIITKQIHILMRTFTNTHKATIATGTVTMYKIILTSMFVYGFTRCIIGLFDGSFDNVTFGLIG